MLLSPCVLCRAKCSTYIYPSVVNRGLDLKRDYTEEALQGGASLPSEGSKFSKVVADSGSTCGLSLSLAKDRGSADTLGAIQDYWVILFFPNPDSYVYGYLNINLHDRISASNQKKLIFPKILEVSFAENLAIGICLREAPLVDHSLSTYFNTNVCLVYCWKSSHLIISHSCVRSCC